MPRLTKLTAPNGIAALHHPRAARHGPLVAPWALGDGHDERSPSWPGPHEPFLREYRDGPPHGVAAEFVLLRQEDERRHRAAWAQVAGFDPPAQDVRELGERRYLAVVVDAHMIKVAGQALPGSALTVPART